MKTKYDDHEDVYQKLLLGAGGAIERFTTKCPHQTHCGHRLDAPTSQVGLDGSQR
jgi:hypothetical protein